jgi:transcriptional regulator with XRE-family HTH domain
MKYAYVVSAIGERLLLLRRERDGLEAAAAARALKITPSALSQLERGTTKNPRPDTLLAASRFFDVSIFWLITGTGPRKHVEAETESEAQALELFRRLGAGGQAAALAHLEWMAARESPGKPDGDFDMPDPRKRLQ